MYVDIFQSDPRVVFSVADVLACYRETRWYSDNAGVVLSVADVSQTRDHRFSADARVVFSFVAALACHQQTRQFSADACAVFSVGGVHRAPQRLLAYVRCLVLALIKPTSLCNLSSLSNAVVIANQALNRMPIERIRIDTCADDGMPAGRTIGMHVSGLRGSLEPTMDRKRQLHRKFADYYSRSFSFARIIN